MAQQNDFSKGKIFPLLMKLALPAIAAQVINALYNIIDRMYLGHIPGTGSLALTGVGLCFPILLIISAFASLVGMGGAPLASIKIGENNPQKAEELLGNAATLLVGFGIFSTAFFLIFGKPLLYLFGASEQTILYAYNYLVIYVSGSLFVMLSLGLNAFITAQGFARQGMTTVLIGAVCNIVLDPIFIYVFDMGVQGAAIATIISQAISAVWVLRFLTGNKTMLRLKKHYFKVKWINAKSILLLGLSPFIMQSTESLVQISLNMSAQHYGGDIYVGVMTILGSLMQLVFMPINGFTQGAQPIIGYNFGARQHARVKTTVKYSFLCCMTFSILYWTTLQLFPDLYVSIFTSDAALMEIAPKLTRIFMFGTLLLGAQSSFQNAFIALGRAKTSIFLALLRKVILLIPLVLLLPLVLPVTPVVEAVYFAEPIADILAATTTTIVFCSSINKILRNHAPQPQA